MGAVGSYFLHELCYPMECREDEPWLLKAICKCRNKAIHTNVWKVQKTGDTILTVQLYKEQKGRLWK